MRLMPKEPPVDPEEERKKAKKTVQENIVLFAVSVAIIRAREYLGRTLRQS